MKCPAIRRRTHNHKVLGTYFFRPSTAVTKDSSFTCFLLQLRPGSQRKIPVGHFTRRMALLAKQYQAESISRLPPITAVVPAV